MPILDARSIDEPRTAVHCDVCIVGAGAAGAYLGRRLASMGIRVVIIEAGGHPCRDGPSVGIESMFDGEPYRGVTEGRAFGFGGSTSSWGGLLIAHSDFDIRSEEENTRDPWRHLVETVKQETGQVLTELALSVKTHQEPPLRRLLAGRMEAFSPGALDVAMGEFLPFRHKNMAGLLRRLKGNGERLTVFLNAVAMEWQIVNGEDGGSRLKSLTARAGDKAIEVSAGSFVLAAGAIESARLLLEMEQQSSSSPFRQDAAIGCYLGDHLSCNIAEVACGSRDLTARLFAPRFVRGRMRNFRFLDHSAPTDSPRCFAHFVFENENAGFQLAKKLLGGLQARTWPKLSLKDVTNGAMGFMALGWARVARSRLYVPPKTPVHLQLDIEQHRTTRNCIRLGDQVDALGRPIPIIKWGVHDEDYRAIYAAATRLLGLWPGKEKAFPQLDAVETPAADRNKPHDAYHPVGTCSMGTEPDSVVDLELRVHGMPNLSVLSTAVFPTAGSANPTFSMLCLGEALAKRLAKERSH